jgi:hypothetical protein
LASPNGVVVFGSGLRAGRRCALGYRLGRAKIPKSGLAPVTFPAQAIACSYPPDTDDLNGQEISIGDPRFQARAGLPE